MFFEISRSRCFPCLKNLQAWEVFIRSYKFLKDRIYVCHTYYHVYVTFLKELNLPKEKRGQATLVLSSLSTRFENLKERVESTKLFEEVLIYDEKRDFDDPMLAKWRKPKKNAISKLLQRIIFTKKYGEYAAKSVEIDYRKYKDVYVFCDTDPIGYYLNRYRIPYHALEDGLNCLKYYDSARVDNPDHFKLKVFLSNKCNLLFIQNGYGKYCIDMEVNDISALKYSCPKYIEVPRAPLTKTLTAEDKELILKAFVRNREELEQRIMAAKDKEDMILILTEPLCTLDVREQIFRDLTREYEKEGTVFLKPHPRDELDYEKLFSDYPQFDPTIPMEILNYFPGLRFKKVVSVFTETKAIEFADEIVRLGSPFMDKYEDHEVHKLNEGI